MVTLTKSTTESTRVLANEIRCMKININVEIDTSKDQDEKDALLDLLETIREQLLSDDDYED